MGLSARVAILQGYRLEALCAAPAGEPNGTMRPSSFRRRLLLRRGKENERDDSGCEMVEHAQGFDPCQTKFPSVPKLNTEAWRSVFDFT